MRSWANKYIGILLTAAAAIVGVVVVVIVAARSSSAQPGMVSGSSARPHYAFVPGQSARAHLPLRAKTLSYLGVYEPDAPQSYLGVEHFERATGKRPNVVLYFSGWGEQFQAAFARTAASHGATTLVQIDPRNISLAKVASGRYDTFLALFADEVAAFGQPVIIGFGHEMNGPWYSWGYHHTRPSIFVAAWRHVVTVFRAHGAHNVTWLWTVNRNSPQCGPIRDWWPGARYVTWVGVDGYYYRHSDTFNKIFRSVTADIRRLTKDPILIAETAVGPLAGQARGIRNMILGLRAYQDIGFVWFDRARHAGLYHQDWRLEASRAAIAAFDRALRAFP